MDIVMNLSDTIYYPKWQTEYINITMTLSLTLSLTHSVLLSIMPVINVISISWFNIALTDGKMESVTKTLHPWPLG